MNPDIFDLSQRIVFVPVRHHSPACARLARRLVLELRPDAVLVEGPSDFNPQFDQLLLPHRLPIAVHSWFAADGVRRGAFYPFCIHSPEWQAIVTAAEIGARARFIDLPWSKTADERAPAHRYGDADLRECGLVAALCRKIGVESFDDLWDTLFEIDGEVTPAEFLKRGHMFCLAMREAESRPSVMNLRREAFMAGQIRVAANEFAGRIVVVTGGFHSYALFARLRGVPFEDEFRNESDEAEASSDFPAPAAAGIALTPYSHKRLDALTGYEAGMPNPGFYHQVWTDHADGGEHSYRHILERVVEDLRRRKQAVSTADVIAVETTARGLAALRGHARVWRRDLLDGVIGALVKDELAAHMRHPFLDAVHDALRGDERGRLAEGTLLPPLVADIRRVLDDHDLLVESDKRTVELELTHPEDLERGRVLHRLRVLGVKGFERIGGTDFVLRDDLSRLWETWEARWSPDFDASCIEAAIYGATLVEASAARLVESLDHVEPSARLAAMLLLDAALMGLPRADDTFTARCAELIRADGDFESTARALGHLLYLYRYDDLLGTGGRDDLGELLSETFFRSVWLLESLGRAEGKELLAGMRALVTAFEHCRAEVRMDKHDFSGVLARIGADRTRGPQFQGAAVGALWRLGDLPVEDLAAGMRTVADPDMLGDFLTGLFALARETAQRHPRLVAAVDAILCGYSEDEFLESLAPLRLAFSFFTPREKSLMARTLLKTVGDDSSEPLAALRVDAETAARVLGFENRLFKAAEKYGIRGSGFGEEEKNEK